MILSDVRTAYAPSEASTVEQERGRVAVPAHIAETWLSAGGQDDRSIACDLLLSYTHRQLQDNLILIPGISEDTHPVRWLNRQVATQIISTSVNLPLLPGTGNASIPGPLSSATIGEFTVIPSISTQGAIEVSIYRSAGVYQVGPPQVPIAEMPLQLRLRYLDVAYTFPEKYKANRFLEANPHLIDLLYAAVGPLREAFPNSRFTARVDGVPNPDLEENPEAVVVTIWTREDPPEALRRLHNFYKAWWLGCQSTASGRLCFDVGFE